MKKRFKNLEIGLERKMEIVLPKVIIDNFKDNFSFYKVEEDFITDSFKGRIFILQKDNIVWTDMKFDSKVDLFGKPIKIGCFFLNDSEIVKIVVEVDKLGEEFKIS